MRFWDSSAIAPLVLSEPSTPRIRALYASDTDMVIWWGTPVECLSAITRRAREAESARRTTRSFVLALDELISTAHQVAATGVVRARAMRLLEQHPLRAADALQLAAALVWVRDRPHGAAFVCLDRPLCAAAAREGVALVPDDPSAQP